MNSMPKWLDYSIEEMENNNIIKTKYNYDLKLNNIEILSNTYDDVSIFVSKPHMITSVIHNIKLDTNEYVPEGTSIEYYISLSNNPTLDEWIPILPNGSKEVVGEKLFFNERHQAILRFKGKISNLVVKKDGKQINFESSEQDIYGNNVVYLKNMSAQSIYTANYTIANNTVEINKEDLVLKKSTDVFDRLDDQNKVSLLHNAIWENENNIVIMIDNEAGIPGFTTNNEELMKFRNITLDGSDYLYPSGELKLRVDGISNFPRLKNCSNRKKESFLFTDCNMGLPDGCDNLSLKSHYPYIEYFIDKNNIYFAPNPQIFEDGTKIYVTYEYIETPLRFKAILRNNKNNNDITPVLNSYKISLM